MKRIRQYRRLSRVFLILALLSLILQVETVFACSMLSQSGNSQFCCCEDGELRVADAMEHAMGAANSGHATEFSLGDHEKNPTKCCSFSHQLTVKGGALGDPDPLFAESKAQQTLMFTALVFIQAQLWAFADTTATTTPAPKNAGPVTAPGSETYLVTQRLRI